MLDSGLPCADAVALLCQEEAPHRGGRDDYQTPFLALCAIDSPL